MDRTSPGQPQFPPPLAAQFSLLDHIPMGICVLQRDGVVLFWNSCLESWTQIPRKEIVGQPISHPFPHLSQPKYQHRLLDTFEKGLTVVFSSQLHPHLLPCKGLNQKLRVQHTIATPIPTSSGSGFHVMLSIQDVTDLTEQIKCYRQMQETAWAEVEKRQQVEEWLRRDREQEKLIESITHHIRQSLDLREILQTTVTEVQRFLKADQVMVYRFKTPLTLNSDHQNGANAHQSPTTQSALIVEACYPHCLTINGWNDEWSMANAVLEDLSQPGIHLRDRVNAIADLTQSDLNPTDLHALQTCGVRARLTIPIWQGEQVWGVLIAHQFHTPRHWQPWEIDLLKRLENQVAVAIQQAELYQQVRELNTDLEQKVQERTLQLQQSLDLEATLKRITDKVRDSLDEDQILETAVQELAIVLDAECCDTGIYNADYTTSTISHEYSRFPHSVMGQVLNLADTADIHAQLFQGHHFQFCTSTLSSFRLLHGHFAIMACPIFDDQGVLGDIWLFREKAAVFNELEVRLVRQVANQCAIALRQSRLYQTAQAQVDALAKLNQLKDDFLHTISHELRTPLTSIKTSIQLLEILLANLLKPNTTEPNSQTIQPDHASMPHRAKIEQCLKILRDECDREINLVNDILILQHLEAGTYLLQPSSIKLQDWLVEVVESFEQPTQTHQQHLQLLIASNLPTLTCDLLILTRVLKELLTNAHKFTPEGGTIKLIAQLKPVQIKLNPLKSTRAHSAASQPEPLILPALTRVTQASPAVPADIIQIQVINTGIEIPSSELEAIFNQFYRIPSDDPWKYGGTGMGLALVKKLVAYLGGCVEATSQTGQTCFTIELPSHP